jgi:RNA polymerase sigma-70 factor (ECF subfamily)
MAGDLGQIIAGCRAGEPEARHALYERFQRMVFRMAVRMVGAQEAGDLVQETFLRAFDGIGRFQGGAEISTWIYRIAVNECFRHLRGRHRMPATLQSEPQAATLAPDVQLEQADLWERALEQLPAPLRAVFLLRETEELSYQEIAAVLGMSPGTVASQLSRARGQLQAYLRRIEQDR